MVILKKINLMENKRVRLRFAPSPTGGLHMGGVRTALFNYLFAKKHGGDFILRIEDTDQTRYVKGAEKYIIEALNWAGINIDEGVGIGGPHAPYRQSERKELGIYQKYIDQMIASGHAYYAFDTTDELDDMRKRLKSGKNPAPKYDFISRQTMRNSLTLSSDVVKGLIDSGTPYVIRLKVPHNVIVRFNDIIRGWLTVNTSEIDDKVLMKSDGMPTYHFAHIVDDYLMQITHVVRGEEWLPSAPSHVLIYRFLGWEDSIPQMAHIPLILNQDGSKMSKRDKSGLPVFPLNWHDENTGETYQGYREIGFFSDAFVNMLALLGWNPGTTQEIFSMDQLIDAFSFERVNKHGAKFNPVKTKWFNQQYIAMKNDLELAKLFTPVLHDKLVKEGFGELNFDITYIESVCKLMKGRCSFISDIWENSRTLFMSPTSYDESVVSKKWNDQTVEFTKELILAYKNLDNFKRETIESSYKEIADRLGVTNGAVMQLLCVFMIGKGSGPAIFDMFELFGKDEVIKRLENALLNIKVEPAPQVA